MTTLILGQLAQTVSAGSASLEPCQQGRHCQHISAGVGGIKTEDCNSCLLESFSGLSRLQDVLTAASQTPQCYFCKKKKKCTKHIKW